MRVDELERPAAVIKPALVDLTVLVDVVIQHQVLLGKGLLVYHDILRFYRHLLALACFSSAAATIAGRGASDKHRPASSDDVFHKSPEALEVGAPPDPHQIVVVGAVDDVQVLRRTRRFEDRLPQLEQHEADAVSKDDEDRPADLAQSVGEIDVGAYQPMDEKLPI